MQPGSQVVHGNMLVKCPECEGLVSSHAEACPHCGLPTARFAGRQTNGKPARPLIAPDTKILQSDPDAAAKWEDIRLRMREAEAAQRHSHAILQAVAQAEEKQAELLEVLRDRAWQMFSSAGCPSCRAHATKPLHTADRMKFFRRGRLIAALLKAKYCTECGHAW